MTVTTAASAARDLAGLSWDRLAELTGAAGEMGDDAALALLLEAGDVKQRREEVREAARARARAARKALWDQWHDGAWAQYLAAEAECRGYLLARDAPAHVTAWSLWSGPERRAMRWASEELREFWFNNPRVTFTEYARQAAERRPDTSGDEWRADDDSGEADAPAGSDEGTGAGADAEAAPATVPAALPGAVREGSSMATCRHPGRFPPCEDCPGQPEAPAAPAAPQVRSAAAELAAARSARAQSQVAEALARRGEPSRTVAVAGSSGLITPDRAAITPPAVRGGRPDAAALLRRALEEIGLLLTDYVSWPTPSTLIAVILWIAHAAARGEDAKPIWWATPRLLLTSRDNGSGKSTVQDLIGWILGSRTGRMAKVSGPGLANVLSKLNEVVLPDDAQLTFGSQGAASRDIQTVLLNSYSRGGTWVTGEKTVTVKHVFGYACIAGKDSVITLNKDALIDLLARSIIPRLERPAVYMPQLNARAMDRAKKIGVALPKIMGALTPQLLAMVDQLDAEAVGKAIQEADGGRIAQIWRPLDAVALIAGDQWPEYADQAKAELAEASGDLIDATTKLNEITEARDPDRSFWDQVGALGQ